MQFVPGVSEEEKPWVTDEGRLEMLRSHRFNLSFENLFFFFELNCWARLFNSSDTSTISSV